MVGEHAVVCPVLIGRDTALSAVMHALDRAHAAHGRTVLVSGEAGIGKSRLVRDMAARAQTLGFVTLQGACFEADRATPYAPILDLVRVLAATTSPALAAHYFAPAASELVTLFPELRSMFPDAPSHPASDPDEDRRRLFHSFVEAVRGVGRVQPLALVVEDVHWSDAATLDLVLHLARRLDAERIALILTFRSDEIGPRLAQLLADLDRARCASEVALRPLGVGDVSAMLQAIFGGQLALGSAFVDGIHALTEGNPFFVEEMLKALVVAGDLVQAEGAWRARPLERVHVPRTATEAVGRRLAGLSDAARRVASVAAVAGRRFDFRLLQALTQHDEVALLALVRELVDAQLVVEESAERFAFRHALTREAMQARLLARERLALHRAIAAALEREYREDTHEVEDALAYHTFEAGEWESARRYALRAAAHATTLSAPREALQHLERAVAATTNLGERPDPALLVARGRAHETLGAFPQANDDFTAALDAARQSGDRRAEWVALHTLGMLWAARDYQRAGQYRREALGVARASGDPALIAHSLNRVGNWYVNREDPQSGIPYHDEALAIFERAGDERGTAETVDLLAMTHHIAGAQATAAQLYERSLALFTALGDQRGLANALSVLAVCGPSHHSSAGPVCTTVHTPDLLANEQPVRLAGRIGWRAGETFARYLLADCFAWRGEYARALKLARESLASAEEIEHFEWQCGARRVLGVIALDLFALAEALPSLKAARDLSRRLGSATWLRWTGAPFAIGLVAAGQHAGAATLLDEIDALVTRSPSVAAAHADADDTPADARADVDRTLGERFLALARAELALATGAPANALAVIREQDTCGTPRAGLVRARALASLRRWDEAVAALDAARDDASRQGARPLLWRIEAERGAVSLGQRKRLEARRAFDAARAIADELAAALDDPVLASAFRAGVDRAAPPAPPRTRAQTAKAAYGGLTRRERDTAALIVQGKSNRAIARSLGISERTVEGYVAAALSKLGFSSRAQIAVWAAEQGLGSGPATIPGRRA
jgi:DNA-binding CsgD family transcriptional regulator